MQESMKIQTSLIIKYFFKESIECFCNCTIILKFCINSCFDKLKIPQPICFIAYYLSIYLLLECGDMNTIYVLVAPPGFFYPRSCDSRNTVKCNGQIVINIFQILR